MCECMFECVLAAINELVADTVFCRVLQQLAWCAGELLLECVATLQPVF